MRLADPAAGSSRLAFSAFSPASKRARTALGESPNQRLLARVKAEELAY
jgi:hypothetical protein